MTVTDAEIVRAHVKRIAASKMFAESDRLRRFLHYTVESTLANQTDRVKEYVLGREVFDRRDGYDPRLDPIVRVEARRLRDKLAEYYRGPGAADTVRVEYPRGSYVPVFTAVRRPSPMPAQRMSRSGAFAAAVLCIVSLTFHGAAPSAAMTAVIPAQWLWRSGEFTDHRAVTIADELTAQLANRGIRPVVAWPIVAGQSNSAKSMGQMAAALHASQLLAIAVANDGGTTLTQVFDIDPRSGRKYRALSYTMPILTYVEQRALARRIASDLPR